MRRYSVISEQLSDEECSEYVSYGLRFSDGRKTIVKISDLSLKKEKVEKFCERLNAYEVEPDALRDYIEDFLADDF